MSEAPEDAPSRTFLRKHGGRPERIAPLSASAIA
jgi:hypothetical protein